MKKVVIGTCLAGVALALTGCGGGSAGEVVARFNGEEITKDEYLKQLETMDSVLVVLPNGQQVQARPAQSMSTQALSKLVEKQTVFEAARKAGVMPSQQEVDMEKTLQDELNPQFQDQMRALGYSGDDINELLRLQLALYKLTVRGQQEKTLEDAEKYVAENPAQFRQPETATLRWIVVTDPAVRAEVDKMLVNAAFGAAAARYSVVETAKTDNGAFNSGGQQIPQPVAISQQLGELYEPIRNTKEGATSGWFKYRNAWAKVQVESKTPAVDVKPKKAQLEMLRRELSRQEARGANGIQDLLLETLLAAEVNVMPAYLKKNWENLLQALKARTVDLGDRPATTAPAPEEGGGEE